MNRFTSLRALCEDYPGEDPNPTLRDLGYDQNPPLLPERPDDFCRDFAAERPQPAAGPKSGAVWKGEPTIAGGVIRHGQVTITQGGGLTPASR